MNRREYIICDKRGHDPRPGTGWTQCKWCGIWLREVRTVEEREDTPPEAELNEFLKIRQRVERLQQEAEEDVESLKKLRTREKKPAGKKRGRRRAE